VTTVEVYTIEGKLSASELQAAAAGPLSDPVIQEYAVNRPLAKAYVSRLTRLARISGS